MLTTISARGRAALEMTAKRRGVDVLPDQQQQILSTIRRLPPHPDVIESLSRLREGWLPHGGAHQFNG
jgi:hypothetical protein